LLGQIIQRHSKSGVYYLRVDHYDQVIDFFRSQKSLKNLKSFPVGPEVYFITRIQSRKDLTIHINNGKTEEINTGTLEGIGVQVINSKGYMGFAASDRVSPEIAAELFEKAVFLAEQSQFFGSETNQEILKLSPLNKRVEVPQKYPYGTLKLPEIETKLKQLNSEITSLDPRLSVRTLLRLTDEEWRIARSDGTDVIFNTPRSFVYYSITAKSGLSSSSQSDSSSPAVTTYASLPGTDLGIIIESNNLNRLRNRAKKAAFLSLELLNAKIIPSGHYKLVIDYALAKGLAHEAFGHAAETDGLDSSILGENGRLKKGMMVANPRLSIIDGPIVSDYAYQPISAIGIERKTVTIVDHGRLAAGLSDVFSAAKTGVPPSGAERVENCFHLPIARMSNIRIQFDDPIPLEQEFESVTTSDLYRILSKRQLIQPGETVLYLTGFQGGQVNPAFGDFVFHCSGIYSLAEEPVLYKPAIFSGKILSVLQSVSNAIGPLQIDAMGTCGKMGQGVSSCGGSHYFLVIESNPEIMIGGE
jgi:TldD protein